MMANYSVIIGSPVWGLNGVNIFSANLARGLRSCGITVSILLTQPHQFDPKPMALPTDIDVETLSVREGDSWPKRWHTMVSHLEKRAPCISISSEENHEV
jgi:hypothetical protein